MSRVLPAVLLAARAVAAPETAMVVDGQLDDAIWRGTTVLSESTRGVHGGAARWR